MEADKNTRRHRFFSFGGIVARSETEDGTFVPSDICSRIGSSMSLVDTTFDLGGPENTLDVSIPTKRIGRPPKRPRLEPSLLWIGSESANASKDMSAHRSLRGAMDNVVPLAFPHSKCTTSVVDCCRLTYASGRDSRIVRPHLATRTSSDRDWVLYSGQEHWDEILLDGVVEIASRAPDPRIAEGSTSRLSLSQIYPRLSSGGSVDAFGVLQEEGAELMTHLAMLEGVTKNPAECAGATYSALLKQDPYDEISLPPDDEHCLKRHDADSCTTTITAAARFSNRMGCFSTLLTHFDRTRCKWNYQADLAAASLLTLASPYFVSKQRLGQKNDELQNYRYRCTNFGNFLRSTVALGVIKVPIDPKSTVVVSKSSSHSAKARATSSLFTFSLAPPNEMVGTTTRTPLTHAEAVSAFCQLTSTGRTRIELFQRMRALQTEERLESTSLGRRNTRKGRLETSGGPPSHAPCTNQIKLQGSDLKSIQQGKLLSDLVAEKWVSLLMQHRAATSTEAHLPVLLLPPLRTAPIPNAASTINEGAFYHAAVLPNGEGVWMPHKIKDRWIVVSFFARYHRSMTRCKPTMEVYDSLKGDASDPSDIQRIEQRLRDLIATTFQTSAAAGVTTATDAMSKAAGDMLLAPWRILFYPEATVSNASATGLVSMQRLALAALSTVEPDVICNTLTRKSISWILSAPAESDAIDRFVQTIIT
jgi:hypothetical protein